MIEMKFFITKRLLITRFTLKIIMKMQETLEVQYIEQL